MSWFFVSVENISPIKLLIDKRKDLKLTDEQVKQIKNVESTLKDKNQGLFKALDSLRKEIKSGSQSDDGRSRAMNAQREVMGVLGDIRTNYDAALKEAIPLLDEAQQKTANEALQKQRDLADMSRPDDERETHRFIVVLASGALSYAPGQSAQRAWKLRVTRPTSAYGRGGRPAVRAFLPHSRRRDPPASIRVARRCN